MTCKKFANENFTIEKFKENIKQILSDILKRQKYEM